MSRIGRLEAAQQASCTDPVQGKICGRNASAAAAAAQWRQALLHQLLLLVWCWCSEKKRNHISNRCEAGYVCLTSLEMSLAIELGGLVGLRLLISFEELLLVDKRPGRRY